MHPSARFFFDRYNLTERDLEKCLAAALEQGGDYADLYFEYRSTSSLSVDESLVKSATEGVSVGCGGARHQRRAHRICLHGRPGAAEDPESRARRRVHLERPGQSPYRGEIGRASCRERV